MDRRSDVAGIVGAAARVAVDQRSTPATTLSLASALTASGTLDASDPTWARPSPLCAPGATGRAFDHVLLYNDTGADVTVDLTATYTYDGYLHAFAGDHGFFTNLDYCVAGDDDFDPDGAGPLGSASGSLIQAVTIADQAVLDVYVSSFSSAVYGDWSLDVTLVP